ncbi:hypothetical protein Tco_0902461 [Tanacetum coccineum]
MLTEKKYPLKKEILVQMLNLRLESEEESTMALELIRFIKKAKELASPQANGLGWLVRDQTVLALASPNSNDEELSIPEQTATGKGTSNPLMAAAAVKEELPPDFVLRNKLVDSSCTISTSSSSSSSSSFKAEKELDVDILSFLEDVPVVFNIDDDLDASPTLVVPFLGLMESNQSSDQSSVSFDVVDVNFGPSDNVLTSLTEEIVPYEQDSHQTQAINKFHHREADLTLVPSAAIAKDLRQARVTAANKICLWNKGVDSESFHPKFRSHEMRVRLTNGEPDRPLIVHVGRLGVEKSLDFLKRFSISMEYLLQMLLKTLLHSRSNESSSADVVERDGANPYSSLSYLLRLEASTSGSLKKHGDERDNLHAAISTPMVKSREEIASPAELAKAYMGSRPSKVPWNDKNLFSTKELDDIVSSCISACGI